MIGSEQADGRLLERWRRHSDVPVANLYGVSEATVSTTAQMPAQATPLDKVPVGRPISNTQAIVLDAALRPVPRGVVGELFLGGLGVARGLFGPAELTAERFLPNPYGPPGSRLYRTGDLARRLPSGSLDLIGRADAQVKIRGHRIELGEIESRPGRAPGHSAGGGQRPHGRPRGVPPGRVPGLRRRPARRVRSARVPARAAAGEHAARVLRGPGRLPLSASGKLDRNALPAPDAGRLESGRTSRAPETATERRWWRSGASCWDTTRAGVDDDFFELGGHSLLATQVVARVRERLSQELPLRAIFECPSVAALAKALGRAARPPRTNRRRRRLLRRAARAAYRIAASELDPPQIGGTEHVA